MSSDTINQAYLFIIFILNGFLIGIVFDVFRILRKSFDTSNFLTYIEDTLFWIITASIILYSLFKFNNGQFRTYIFAGIFLGIAIYMVLFSRIIIKVSVKIVNFLKSICIYIYNIILYPFKKIFKIICNIIIAPIQHLFLNIGFLFRNIIKKKKKIDKNTEILQNKEGF